MYQRKSDNHLLAVSPYKWTTLQSSGEIADGVLVVEGGKMLVVAPTEASLYWSSAAVSAGGTTTTNRIAALNDWAGKTSTAAQIQHPECSGASYAPGFCAQYSHGALRAGKWWLPSLGELMMIYANIRKINYCLSLISGATQLAETWYLSSTEYNAVNAWILNLYNSNARFNTKTVYQFIVRPVSTFLS